MQPIPTGLQMVFDYFKSGATSNWMTFKTKQLQVVWLPLVVFSLVLVFFCGLCNWTCKHYFHLVCCYAIFVCDCTLPSQHVDLTVCSHNSGETLPLPLHHCLLLCYPTHGKLFTLTAPLNYLQHWNLPVSPELLLLHTSYSAQWVIQSVNICTLLKMWIFSIFTYKP